MLVKYNEVVFVFFEEEDGILRFSEYVLMLEMFVLVLEGMKWVGDVN